MFWDNVAWVYDLFANGINRKANRALCEAVAQMIQPEDEALECACGTGLLSGVIARRCKSLIATDFSVNMLRRAERKYRNLPNIRFEPCDIMQLPYPDERFDVVIAAECHPSAGRARKALQELSRVSPPGRTHHPADLHEPLGIRKNGRDLPRCQNSRRRFQARVHSRNLPRVSDECRIPKRAMHALRRNHPLRNRRPPKARKIRPSSKHRVGDAAHIVPAERTVFMEVSGAFDGAHWVDVGSAPLYNRKICAAL